MTDRTLHRSAAFALALALAASGGPVVAHRHATHHQTSIAHHATKTSRHHATKRAEHHDTKLAGVTGVPAGGIKLFCPARRNPLLIRKSTQGAGTTVTIVCR